MNIFGFVFTLIILFGAPASAVDKWDRTDCILLGTMVAAEIIDWRQTRRIAEQPDRYWEINPLIGRHPSQDRVDQYFLISAVVKVGIAHVLPSQWRKIWLGIMAAGSVGCVLYNNSIGLGVQW